MQTRPMVDALAMTLHAKREHGQANNEDCCCTKKVSWIVGHEKDHDTSPTHP